jgi:GNAT superfamily N-acetyltransferase
VTEPLTVTVCRLRDLSPAQLRTLAGLTRRGRGEMRPALERALACDEIHPSFRALAVIARRGETIIGWALIHATGRLERERRYSRKFVYHSVTWYCYLYVRKSARGTGVGRALIEASGQAAQDDMLPLRVRPWDRASAAFFRREVTDDPRFYWESFENPSRWLDA